MKVWIGHGTEHSMNLVMIGRFEDVGTAEAAKELIDRLFVAVDQEHAEGRLDVGDYSDRYTEQMLQLLSDLNLHVLSPRDFEQFLYDVSVELRGSSILVTTDEIEVDAFMKVMLTKGAKIEVYSAHDYPDVATEDLGS